MTIKSDSLKAQTPEFYQKIAAQLLRAIRGSRSQAVLNRRLGYSFNQVSKWETGKAQIKWLEFVAMVSLCKVDLKPALRILLFKKPASDYQSLVLCVIGGQSTKEFSSRTQVAERKIRRWLGGKQEPTLAEFLSMIDRGTRYFIPMLTKLVPLNQIDVLHQRQLHQKELDHFVSNHPEAVAMMCLLDLRTYRESDLSAVSFISKSLGLSDAEVAYRLEQMKKLKLIRRRYGKYISTPKADQDITMDFNMVKKMNRYWLERVSEVFERQQAGSELFKAGNLVFGTTDEGYELIKQKMVELYSIARQHSAPLDRSNRVGLLLVYLMDLALLNP